MNNKILFPFCIIFALLTSCNTNNCYNCDRYTLVYDSTRTKDFNTERGNRLKIDTVYTNNKTSNNSVGAAVYITDRFATGDTVLIISPMDKGELKKGYHILLDTIENIKFGDSLEIQLPERYFKYLKDRSKTHIARPFMPVQ